MSDQIVSTSANPVLTGGVPAYIQQSLSKGEEVQNVFTLHWFVWVPVWVWAFAALLSAGLLAPIAIYLWLSLRTIEQGLTNKRVITKRGIISRNTDEMKLSSIETVELKQSIFGRIFGFGDVKITGRGASAVMLKAVIDPMSAKRAIESVSNPV